MVLRNFLLIEEYDKKYFENIIYWTVLLLNLGILANPRTILDIVEISHVPQEDKV